MRRIAPTGVPGGTVAPMRLVGAIAALCCCACSEALPAPQADAATLDGAGSTALDEGGPAREEAGAESDGEAPQRGGTVPPGPWTEVGRGETRFVALGDAGEGNEAQFAVGRAIAKVCEERGCDFALYLGDNLYEVGVTDASDRQFQTKFEEPYAPVDLVFHVALGNHDYGALGNDWIRNQPQIEYSERSEKWSLPAPYYAFDHANVHFIALDTSQLFWDHEVDLQRAFVRADLAAVKDRWVVMFGHHPYVSNGRHGNAGHYEGLGGTLGGESVAEFFASDVCGKAHVYLCGHDHDRQWLASRCGTEFLVSGAGAQLTELPRRDANPTHWDDNTVEGFLWVEIVDDSFTGVFFDRDGEPQYERTLTL